MIATTLIDNRDEILRIAAKYGAHDVRVFGSVARGEEREDSDLDLLVEFEAGRSLLDHAGLVLELEALLGRTVDIGTPKGLRIPYRERILSEAVPL
jgi:predicted nucleotidyltransferase